MHGEFRLHCSRVSIPPAVRPIVLRRMDMESLTCAQSWVRAVHTKGGQEQASLYAERVNSEGQKKTVSHPV